MIELTNKDVVVYLILAFSTIILIEILVQLIQLILKNNKLKKNDPVVKKIVEIIKPLFEENYENTFKYLVNNKNEVYEIFIDFQSHYCDYLIIGFKLSLKEIRNKEYFIELLILKEALGKNIHDYLTKNLKICQKPLSLNHLRKKIIDLEEEKENINKYLRKIHKLKYSSNNEKKLPKYKEIIVNGNEVFCNMRSKRTG